MNVVIQEICHIFMLPAVSGANCLCCKVVVGTFLLKEGYRGLKELEESTSQPVISLLCWLTDCCVKES